MHEHVINIIILAGIACFLVYKLWSVLGQRGGEAPPPPLASRTKPAEGKPGDNIVTLPDRGRPPAPPQTRPVQPVQNGIDQIRAAEPGFRPDAFLAGARHAFELIVKAFSDGDTASLRPLVSDEVYAVFAEAIRLRLANKESVMTKLIRQQDPELVEAGVQGRVGFITVRFVSQQISVTRAADNRILEGDPDTAMDRIDVWTFSRTLRANDPNWILVGTGNPE